MPVREAREKGILHVASKLSTKRFVGYRMAIGLFASTCLVLLTSALLVLTADALGAGALVAEIRPAWYEAVRTQFPNLPLSVPSALALTMIVCSTLTISSLRNWATTRGFRATLWIAELFVQGGEWIESRRRWADLLLWSAVILMQASVYGLYRISHERDAISDAVLARSRRVESFLLSATLNDLDVIQFRSISPSAARSKVWHTGEIVSSEEARLDSLVTYMFDRPTFQSRRGDGSTGTRRELVDSAYEIAHSSAISSEAGLEAARFEPRQRHIRRLFQLLKARLALDRLKHCDLGCPSLSSVLSDLAAVREDTTLATEAANASARVYSWALGSALGFGRRTTDSLALRCRAAIAECVDSAIVQYDRSVRRSDSRCGTRGARRTNNRLDLLVQLAEAQVDGRLLSADLTALPAWFRTQSLLADSLAAQASLLLDCTPQGQFVTPHLVTSTEASIAHLRLRYPKGRVPARESENAGTMLRLALAINPETANLISRATICALHSSSARDAILSHAESELQFFPNAGTNVIRDRIKRECA